MIAQGRRRCTLHVRRLPRGLRSVLELRPLGLVAVPAVPSAVVVIPVAVMPPTMAISAIVAPCAPRRADREIRSHQGTEILPTTDERGCLVRTEVRVASTSAGHD
jgi:hypothetical protein